jgi:hypothetical protein
VGVLGQREHVAIPNFCRPVQQNASVSPELLGSQAPSEFMPTNWQGTIR